MKISNRIIGHGEEAPDQLLANPANWRTHPPEQQTALEAVLEKVGWVQSVIVNQKTGFLVDGHLRVMLAMRRGEKKIPVSYVNLSSAEESLILATIDPISALADMDIDKLKDVVSDISELDSEPIEALLAGLLDEGKEKEERGHSEPLECPECGYRFDD